MESVQDLLHSTLARWRTWSLMQRMIFGFAAGVILLGTLTLGLRTEEIRYVPLSLGKQFSPDDLTSIEQSLREKSLTTFRREAHQILVPEYEQTAYDAALLQEQQLPQDWASEWEQKFEATNPFTSSRKLRMLKEIALAKELKRIIQGLDGVEEANVVWAETETHSWKSRQQKVTASVNIRPEQGNALSEQTIRAIQFSVANMVPNLDPQDVIVFDYSAGRHYQLQPHQARFETDLQQWIDRELARWRERLSPALTHHWPDAQLRIRIRQEELRRAAWQWLQTSRSKRESERTFREIELDLQHRFPEYMQLSVSLPGSSGPNVSGTPVDRVALEEEVLAALIGWLPPSFDAHQLVVNSHSSLPDVRKIVATDRENNATSWQPLMMVGVAGVLLFLVSRRFQSSSTSAESHSGLAPEAEETAPLDPQSSTLPQYSTNPQDSTMEPSMLVSSGPPVTPLGDPEQVAEVLKQWLGSAHASNHAGPLPPASRGSD